MDTKKRVFRYLTYDQLKGVGIFWLVMTMINILATIVAFSTKSNLILGPMLIDEQVITFAGSNIFSAYIFFIIYGIVMYYESFTLVGGFGVARKNFYLNVIVNNIIVVLLSSIIQIVLMKIDNYAISKLGFEPMVDFGLFNMNDNIILNILLLSFIFLVFVSMTNLLGVMQYRFGYKLWIGLGIFLLVSQATINFIGRIFGSFMNIILDSNFELTNHLILGVGSLIILLAYSIGFIFIRRVNIK